MLKRLVVVFATVFALVTPVGVAGAALKAHRAPVVVSFSLAPKTVSGAGGSIRLTVKVKNAKKCIFGGAGTVMKSCAGGKATVLDKVVANSSATIKKGTLWVYATGPGGRSARKTAKFTQAAAPTSCVGPCKFTFPTPDDEDIASITLNSVSQSVGWPDPNPYSNDLPAGDQLDALNATACAGSTGINDVALLSDELSLSLSSGGQASVDSVTFDSSVPSAFGNYGAVGPGQCVTGNIYFDALGGSTWTSVDFGYYSGTNQLVYVWHAS